MDRSPAAAPDFVVETHGRVNLIGEHTDYNDGFVMPMAIERGIRCAVSRRPDRLIRLRSDGAGPAVEIDAAGPLVPGRSDWGHYPLGVIAGYAARGFDIPGCDIAISADLPAGGGLSSSAALEVAIATVIEALCGHGLPEVEKALLCQEAEHRYAGVPCGIMDQFAVTCCRPGHALLLDCRSRAITHVPLADPTVVVLVIDSGVKHDLVAGEYAGRRNDCRRAAARLGVATLRDLGPAEWPARAGALPDVERRRVAHVVSENARVQAFAASVDLGDFVRAGRIMVESHWSLARDYEVSCPELDTLVNLAIRVPGVLGCRMTGGGFGGCTVAFVRSDMAAAASERIVAEYRAATGRAALAFVTTACGGPKVIPGESPGASDDRPLG
jgi:galactokinase